jgi:hypothetical protein
LASGPQSRSWKKRKSSATCTPFGVRMDVSRYVTLQQSMAFELAQVLAQLVQAFGFVGDVERGEDGLVVQPPDVTAACRGTSRRRMTRGARLVQSKEHKDHPMTPQAVGDQAPRLAHQELVMVT